MLGTDGGTVGAEADWLPVTMRMFCNTSILGQTAVRVCGPVWGRPLLAAREQLRFVHLPLVPSLLARRVLAVRTGGGSIMGA